MKQPTIFTDALADSQRGSPCTFLDQLDLDPGSICRLDSLSRRKPPDRFSLVLSRVFHLKVASVDRETLIRHSRRSRPENLLSLSFPRSFTSTGESSLEIWSRIGGLSRERYAHHPRGLTPPEGKRSSTGTRTRSDTEQRTSRRHRRRKANWTERRRLALASAACSVWWRPLPPATRTATATTMPTPTPTPFVATMARRGSRSSALISLPLPPVDLSTSSFHLASTHPHIHPSRPPSRAGPPLLYRSYGRGPLVRSICLVRAENANRARSIWTAVRKAE